MFKIEERIVPEWRKIPIFICDSCHKEVVDNSKLPIDWIGVRKSSNVTTELNLDFCCEDCFKTWIGKQLVESINNDS